MYKNVIKAKGLLICLVLVMPLLCVSCASMMNGDMVTVPVQINPDGAELKVNGQHYYQTPATISLPRGEGNFTLHIEKEGYEPMDIELRQSSDGWLWGNLLLGGIVGLVVDYSTGDAYDLDPEEVNVTLIKSESLSFNSTDGTKAVIIDMSQLKPEIQEIVRANSKKD